MYKEKELVLCDEFNDLEQIFRDANYKYVKKFQTLVWRFSFISLYQFDKIFDNHLAFSGYDAFWMELYPLHFSKDTIH